MRGEIKYSKAIFSKKEVLDQRKKAQYPSAWNIKESRFHWKLIFNHHLAKRLYKKNKMGVR